MTTQATRLRPVLIMALMVTALVTAVGYRFAAADDDAMALGPGEVTVRIDIEHSRFLPERLVIAEGTRVRFLVVNGDPIHHEFITGSPEVHRRHAQGTEAQHPSIPGEVSVDPNGRAITTFTFEESGRFEFACHLPRHYAYGMHGEIEVVPAAAE
ncbi:MAG TPA: plastocyanin/azurin family copper-binding protein [Acidimicrobiia bacterium]|nr:plastocyanin/azurin family copper-binding protein [Acidimicrobiia bacterium]